MRFILFLFCLALLPGSALGGIAAVGGSIVEIPTPVATELGQLQSNTEIFVFNEVEGVTLFEALPMDASTSGLYDALPTLELAGVGAARRVDSYALHFDPLFGARNPSGSITFDRPIIGVIALDDTLVATDGTLAAPGTSYPIPLERGLELDLMTEDFTISADRLTLDVELTASTALDQIRVVTAAAVPVPSLSPSGLALVGASILLSTLVVTRHEDRK